MNQINIMLVPTAQDYLILPAELIAHVFPYAPPLLIDSGSEYIIGGLLAVAMAGSIFGGTRRLSDITSFLVPVMAIIYLGVGIIVVLMNWQLVIYLCKPFDN